MGYLITKVLPYVGDYEVLERMPMPAVMEISRNIDRRENENAARTYSATLAAIADAFDAKSEFYDLMTAHIDEVIITEEAQQPQTGAKGIAQLKAKLGIK